jgi:WD40 repeat protein
VGSYDKTIRIFDVRTQEEKAVLAGHDGSIHSVALAPDGKILASAGRDQVLHLWDVAKKERVFTAQTKYDRPVVRFTPDGKTLAVAGLSDGVQLLDVQTKVVRDTLKSERGVEAIDITPDGKFLAMAYVDIQVWDLTTRKERVFAGGHKGMITAVALSADGKVLASGSADETIKLWDVETGKVRMTIPQRRSVVDMVMTPDGKLLASAGLAEGTIRLWNTRTGKEIDTIEPGGHLLIGHDGKTLIAGAGRSWVKVWDLPDVDGQ